MYFTQLEEFYWWRFLIFVHKALSSRKHFYSYFDLSPPITCTLHTLTLPYEIVFLNRARTIAAATFFQLDRLTDLLIVQCHRRLLKSWPSPGAPSEAISHSVKFRKLWVWFKKAIVNSGIRPRLGCRDLHESVKVCDNDWKREWDNKNAG